LSAVNSRLGTQYEQVVDLLSRRLGPAHARLLAEPVPVALANGGRAGLAWFTEGDGPAYPAGALGEAEAARLRHEASRLRGEIAAFADALEREGESSRDLARLLRDALVTPDGDHLWSVDGHPVLVAWGFRAAGASEGLVGRTGAIMASAAAAPPPSAAAAPPPPPWLESARPLPPPAVPSSPSAGWARPAGALLWAAVVVVGVLLGGRLLQACAIGNADWPAWLRSTLPNHCPVASVVPDPAGAAALAAIRAVERDVHEAEIALTRRAAACEVSCPAPARATAVEPPRAISPDVARRLERIERGHHLELTLAWEGPSDLDLHVTCPNQSSINFVAPEACGARLVADQNRGGGLSDSRPIEHVIWNGPPTPEGVYRIAVALYKRHGDARAAIPFKVVLSRAGQLIREEAGEVSQSDDRRFVLSFAAPLPPPLQASDP
jgi:hypothetical protein